MDHMVSEYDDSKNKVSGVLTLFPKQWSDGEPMNKEILYEENYAVFRQFVCNYRSNMMIST